MKEEPENTFLGHHSLQIPEKKVYHKLYETMNEAQKIEE